MNIDNVALVLEGGGMRGVYTSGILRFFMEKQIWFPYVIGVSMGACNAANYLSRQIERNKIVNIDYVNDSRYLSYRRLLTKGELFGMDFIFDTIPNRLEPFDYQVFYRNQARCVTVVTDCVNGSAGYFEKSDLGPDYMKILRASSSLPFISKPVSFNGRFFMDGGMADSIPVKKCAADGFRKQVIILTQPETYRKSAERLAVLASIKYPQFPGLCSALKHRHIEYNNALDDIRQRQNEGDVFVIRPRLTLPAGRIERRKSVLHDCYKTGYDDAAACFKKLEEYLEK